MLSLRARGVGIKAIARQLDISDRCVDQYVRRAVAKLDAIDTTNAVAMAIHLGIISLN